MKPNHIKIMYHLFSDEVAICKFVVADANWDNVGIFNHTYIQAMPLFVMIQHRMFNTSAVQFCPLGGNTF